MQPSDELKCKIASYTLIEEADSWWQRLQRERIVIGKSKVSSWPRMKRILGRRFSSANCLMKVQSSVFDYKLGNEGMRSYRDEPYHTTAVREMGAITDEVQQIEATTTGVVKQQMEECSKERSDCIEFDVLTTENVISEGPHSAIKANSGGGVEVVEHLKGDNSTPTTCLMKIPCQLNSSRHKQVEDSDSRDDFHYQSLSTAYHNYDDFNVSYNNISLSATLGTQATEDLVKQNEEATNRNSDNTH